MRWWGKSIGGEDLLVPRRGKPSQAQPRDERRISHLHWRPTPVRLHHFWRRAPSRERCSYGLHFQRHTGTDNGYRWKRNGERGTTSDWRGPRERCESAANAGTSSARAKKFGWGKEPSRLRISMSGPWDAGESLLLSRPGSHLPRVAFYLLLSPCPRLPYILRPSTFHSSASRTRSPARPLACAQAASLALNLPLGAASRKPDGSAISHAPSVVCLLYILRLRFFCIPHQFLSSFLRLDIRKAIYASFADLHCSPSSCRYSY